MKETDLLRAIGEIDEKYILEAAPGTEQLKKAEEGSGKAESNTEEAENNTEKAQSSIGKEKASEKAENGNILKLNRTGNRRRVRNAAAAAACAVVLLGTGIWYLNLQKQLPAMATAGAAAGMTTAADSAAEAAMTEVEADAETDQTILYAAEGSETEGGGTEAASEEMQAVGNPWLDLDTLEAAEKEAGFTMIIPEAEDSRMNTLYRAIPGEMLEVIRENSAGEEQYRIRKGKGSDDISGDYNVYAEEETVSEGERTITLRGDGNGVKLAIWQQDGYSYSVSIAGAGMAREAVLKLAAGVS